jgi:hypothetical protein
MLGARALERLGSRRLFPSQRSALIGGENSRALSLTAELNLTVVQVVDSCSLIAVTLSFAFELQFLI